LKKDSRFGKKSEEKKIKKGQPFWGVTVATCSTGVFYRNWTKFN